MALTPKQLKNELAAVIDPAFADAIVDSYVEMQQRFLAGDGSRANSMVAAFARPSRAPSTSWIAER